MTYRLHYLSRSQPAPYKVSGVLCPDGEERDTRIVWCFEGHSCRATININGTDIDGHIIFTDRGYNLFVFKTGVAEARFLPNREHEFWSAVLAENKDKPI